MPRKPDDHTPRREVGTLDVLRDPIVVEVGILDKGDRRVDDLAKVVRRDLGRHSHGDAVRAVDEQIREPRRQHLRLALALVEVRHEVDGVGTDVPQHLRRHPLQAGLCVMADEAVGQERVILGVYPDRIDRLNPGVFDRLDLGVVVAAGDEWLDNGPDLFGLDPLQDRRPPPSHRSTRSRLLRFSQSLLA